DRRVAHRPADRPGALPGQDSFGRGSLKRQRRLCGKKRAGCGTSCRLAALGLTLEGREPGVGGAPKGQRIRGLSARTRLRGGARLRTRLLGGVATVALAAPASRWALAQEAKWAPYIEAGGMGGNTHSWGDVDIFIPLWQDQTSVLFGDLRGTFSTEP